MSQRRQKQLIQKAPKVCKTFKLKSLKTLSLDVPQKKTTYNLFLHRYLKEKRVKRCHCFQISANKKLVTKRSNKYSDFYEAEIQRYEEALQIPGRSYYELEIISLLKR